MTDEGKITCGEMMKRICDILGARANNALKEQDITFRQMRVIMMLSEREDKSVTLKELEKLFDVSQATAAGIAKRLENKGCIEGYVSPDDKRVKHIRLAERGSKLCECACCAVNEGEDQLVAALDVEEREEFRRLLGKVYESVRGEEDDR